MVLGAIFQAEIALLADLGDDSRDHLPMERKREPMLPIVFSKGWGRMLRRYLPNVGLLLIILVGAALVPVFSQLTPNQGDWPEYGHDAGGARFSPLTQINAANVAHLAPAWTYHTGEIGRSFETTPILVNNVLYLSTEAHNIVALDPVTGKEIWKYDTKSKPNQRETRGVAYWPGDKQNPPRILFGTGDGRLIALDAKTGTPAAGFGDNGSVDLRAGVLDKFPNASWGISSPPTIYRDVAIVGPATQEGPALGPPGDPRGFDVRTGKLLWVFHSTPRPGEPGNDSWGPSGWKDRAGPSQWGPGTLDPKLGIVYLPIGNPADSYYGGDRPGNDLYSASVIALDAQTGKLRWYYQITHHDIWDYDMSAPPALVEVKRDGKTIPALAQITKQSLLFILDRRTGKPVFGVEERPVPKGDVPGEWYSPTEPFPVKPPPLARMSLNKDQISTRSPEAQKFCSDWFSTLHNDGPFTPFGMTPTLLIPGSMGGGDWGGVSFDPQLGYIFANTNNLAGVGQMVKTVPGAPASPYRAGPPMPYHNSGGATRFVDKQGYPCDTPPWALLTAVNANTGDIVWQKPLGSYDALEAQGLKDTGAPLMGGSIATAGGLVFVAGTTDSKFRAFDSRTGNELWVTKLPATGTAVPMTYMGSDGKQYVVIAAGGSNRFRMIAGTADQTSDSLIAYALSANQTSESGPPAGRAPVAPGEPAASTSAAPVTAAPAAAAAAPVGSLPDGPEKATVIKVCTTCHGASNFTTIGLSRTGWENEVQNMKGNGAVGTDAEFKQVIDYLTRNFPSR
jgi:glucose dehydrogenase